MTDERLCWLILRDELRQRSGKLRFLGRLRAVIGGHRASSAFFEGDLRREDTSARMSGYAVAVDASAQTLSPDERRHLRSAGEVPEWFRPDVERRYQEFRRRR
ncbi:hypothetical protein [Streptomyces sp. NPDC059371]|uniref:hypothetical protein n=1 Tax=Streptomyces sp. NPDC059371 TaxID=3346812 RepID=UPI0036CE4FD4